MQTNKQHRSILTLRSFRITGKHIAMVKHMAHRQKLSESEVVRQAIEQTFKKEA